jgi:GWxTD domain-containing protein
MSKRLSLASCCFFIATLSLASTPLPELFQQAKQQFNQASYSDALKTLDEMVRRSAEPENEKYRAGMAPALAFYRGACLAALGRKDEARAEFETYLASKPNAQLDPAGYPKKVIVALEDARRDLEKKNGHSAQQTSIADEYKAFQYQPRNIEQQTDEHWLQGPLLNLANLNLMTPEEQRAFTHVSDPVSRREFLTKFWASRDPDPATPENEAREEFERRVAFADAHFAQDEIRGSLTDRGVVFVLLGPPTYIGRQPIRTGEDPNDSSGMRRFSAKDVAAVQKATGGSRVASPAVNAAVDKMTGPANIAPNMSMRWREVWHYRKELLPKKLPYQEVNFEFITREGYGDNVMQRDATALNALDVARKTLQSPAAP